MITYFIKRLLVGFCGVLIVSFVIFVGLRFAPGDPADLMIPGVPTPEERASIHKQLGLDKPVIIQYLIYIKNIFMHGDLGMSYYSHEPVIDLLKQRIPITFQLVIPVFILVLLVGIPTGFIAVLYRNSLPDYMTVVAIYTLQALPNFWIGIVLILFFAVRFPILPAFGRGGIETMVLPTIALATPLIGRVTKFVRNGLIDIIREDYIRTAFSKGLSKRNVYIKHAFKNAAIPLVTDVSMQFVWLIGNAIVIEEVFGWGGIGRLTLNSLRLRDYPTAQACVLFFAVAFMIVNLLVDISYRFLDPRVKINK